ncbi:MAG: hypothetical protein ACRC5M_02170, partial [Anaeroplasmataceae bacterium]
MNNLVYTGHCDFSPLAGNCKISAGFFQGTNNIVLNLVPLKDSRVISLNQDDIIKVYVFVGDKRIFEEDKTKLSVSYVDESGNIVITPFEELTEYDGTNTLMIEVSSNGIVSRSNEIYYTVSKNKTHNSKGGPNDKTAISNFIEEIYNVDMGKINNSLNTKYDGARVTDDNKLILTV